MVEEVTVSSATAGADSSGQGAVQIKFVTRSGTNRFVGSAYEYLRHPDLNTNNYFNALNNLPKNELILNQYGVREGGPIVIPGVYDGRGKAFFFFNLEQLRFPLSNTRTRGILSPQAQQGIFQYAVSGAVQQVNLLELAAQERPDGDHGSDDCRAGGEDSRVDRHDRCRERPDRPERAGLSMAARVAAHRQRPGHAARLQSDAESPVERELQLSGTASDPEPVRRRRSELPGAVELR